MNDKLFEEIKQTIKNQKLNIDLGQTQYFIIKQFKQEMNNGLGIIISWSQALSEDFIKEFCDELDWPCISSYQILSEAIIREYKDEVKWNLISYCQVLSENFIREFKNKVCWENIYRFQDLSSKFIEEFKEELMPYIEKEYGKLIHE